VAGGYVFEVAHNGVGYSLLVNAPQISAGIGNNSTGVDLYYLDKYTQLHYFNGSTDTAFGLGGIQISAGLSQAGNRECYILGYDNSLYTVSNWGQATWDGNNIAQISGAQNDMVFVVAIGNDQISAFDPNNMWWQEWSVASSQGYSSWRSWHYWGGISANPNS
jgi:hypothetical protein